MKKSFIDKLSKYNGDVILLEGTRSITGLEDEALTRMGHQFATLLPNSTFRSGNAPGSDNAFIKGVSEVDGANIELILPFSNHRKKSIPAQAKVFTPEELNEEELKEIITIGSKANPKLAGLLSLYKPEGKNLLSIKSSFLIRDVVKVTGILSKDFGKASAGVFHVNHQKQGGTGFTMNVCKHLGVEYYTQEDYEELKI